MNKQTLAAGAAAVILALGAGGAGVAYAADGDSGEQVTGPDAGKAKSAALDAVGGGTVTEVERDDGNAAFEVEVRRDDGSQVEVHLDQDLKVVGQQTDDDSTDEDGTSDEDGPNDD